jgi:hypothetical protein
LLNEDLKLSPEAEVQKKEKLDPVAIFSVKENDSPSGDHQTVYLG